MLDFIYEITEKLLDPEKLILFGGFYLILLIIYAENGLFFCFFFPGDTLLFTAGILCSTGFLHTNIATLCIGIWLAAILGNLTGYGFGWKVGKALYNKKDTLLFKKKYLQTAEIFFNKYGGMALIMGRFLPIVRTFAPIFAGVVKFNFRKFLFFNIAGGFLWVFSLVLAGYFIAEIFPQIKNYLEYFILGIIVITWIPVIRTYLKERNRRKSNIDQDIKTEKENLSA
jgi:membrane-associated protein